jgi:hypothetical protein
MEISSSPRDRHGKPLAEAVIHGLTKTDIRINHSDQVFPMLQKAKTGGCARVQAGSENEAGSAAQVGVALA